MFETADTDYAADYEYPDIWISDHTDKTSYWKEETNIRSQK